MKEALLNESFKYQNRSYCDIGIKRYFTRTMKTMVWFIISLFQVNVNVPESKAQHQFSVYGSLAERLSNGTYALSSNSDKTIFATYRNEFQRMAE